ncbi:MAG: hypothetical protein ACI9HB_002093, partial [Gammaproteobacteria bacterium]
NHQGQRPRAPRKQAGHTSASDQCLNQLQICLALQRLSTQDIRRNREIRRWVNSQFAEKLCGNSAECSAEDRFLHSP